MRSLLSYKYSNDIPGYAGLAYLRYSNEPIVEGNASDICDDIAIDYDASGNIVGIELVRVDTDSIAALGVIAKAHALDLSPIFARPAQAAA